MCPAIVEAIILCTTFLHYYPDVAVSDEAFEVCIRVARDAAEVNVPPELLISLSYYESRFELDSSNERTGAVGPLQVLPRHHCYRLDEGTCQRARNEATGDFIRVPTPTCDLLRVGACALRRYLTEEDNPLNAVRRYNGGRNYRNISRTERWARLVVSTANNVRRMSKKSMDGICRTRRTTWESNVTPIQNR